MIYSKPQRKTIDRAAVRKSLRELEALFGRKVPDPIGNPTRERGVGEAVQPICKASKMKANSNVPSSSGQPLLTLKGISQ